MTQPARRTPSTRSASGTKPSSDARPGSRGGQAPGTAPVTDRKQAAARGATDRVRATADDRWPMAERSLVTTVSGVPPAAAVGLAAVLTAVGVVVDLTRAGTLGTVFTVCYVVGCVLAVAWVRRSGLFAPVVAPPLLLAVSVPVVVLIAGTPKPGAGVAQRLLVIGAPLVNSFPTMAWTTGIVVAIGVFRLLTQRLRPRRGTAAKERPPKIRPRSAAVSRAAERRGAPDAARAAARTSTSPPRS